MLYESYESYSFTSKKLDILLSLCIDCACIQISCPLIKRKKVRAGGNACHHFDLARELL
jgi:succinate dehydrogenase/fumarate reductase-like Fe-S protein